MTVIYQFLTTIDYSLDGFLLTSSVPVHFKNQPIVSKSIMMFRVLIPVMLLVLASLSALAQEEHHFGKYSFFTDPNTPAWVVDIKAAKSKGEKSGQPTEYLLVDTQVLADADNFSTYKRRTSALHTSQAVAEGSEIHVWFNPTYQELHFHTINVIRNGTVISALDPNIIRLIQQEQDLRNGLMDGVVTAIAIIPDTRTGDILDYSYSVKGRNPIFGPKVFGAYPAGWSVDVEKLNLRVLVPQDIDIQSRVHLAKIKEKVRKKGQYTEHRWQAKNIKAISDEGDYPAWFQRFAWIEFSEFKNWKEVAAWARQMYDSVDNKSGALQALVESLSKNARDNEDYLLKALDFVQEDIRYLGLEFGINSHLPHTPAEVLDRRFGDCKDKSNLLVQLLKAKGISAESALVSTDHLEGFKHFLPSPAVFNHVIVRAEIDGKTVWLDPTNTFQSGDIEKLGFIYYGAGLLIDSSTENPIQEIKPLVEQKNTISVEEHFTVSDLKKPAAFTVKSQYQGASAEYQRYQFAVNSLTEVQELYLNYYAKFYPKIKLSKDIEYKDDQENNQVIVTESYAIPDFLSVSEKTHSAGFYASGISMNLRIPEKRLRETPIAIGDPRSVQHKIIFDMPEGAGMYVDGTPFYHKQNGFQFKSRSAHFANRFEYDASLSIEKSSVEGGELSKYIDAIGVIQKDIDFTVNFVYPYKQEMSESYSKLLKTLKK